MKTGKAIALLFALFLLTTICVACGQGEDKLQPDPINCIDAEEEVQQVQLPEAEPHAPPLPQDEAPALPPMPEPIPKPAPEPETEPVPQPTDEPQIKRAQYIMIVADRVNIRAGAGTNFNALGTAEMGTMYAYTGKTGCWYQTYYRGREAYISSNSAYTKVVSLPEAQSEIESVIEEGLRLLGTPYVYGATRYLTEGGSRIKNFTVEEFDCSSLMQYIFYRGANIKLLLTTRTQVTQGILVPKDQIRRGDLLFFTNASRKNKSGIERIGHVALYLGEGYILHTASDYAKIEKLTPLRQSYFITARRLL